MNDIYLIYKLYIFNNGYSRNTIQIVQGPKPENFYENEPYNFDVF